MDNYDFELRNKNYYDSLQSKYEEEATVPFTDYLKLEEKNDELKDIITEMLEFINEQDWKGLEGYAKKIRY